MGHWWTCAVLNCIIASHNRLIYHMICLRRAICTMSASFTCLTQIIMCMDLEYAWDKCVSFIPWLLLLIFLATLGIFVPGIRLFLKLALSKCLRNKSDLVHRAGLDFEIAFARNHCRWMHHISSEVCVSRLWTTIFYQTRQTLPTGCSS